LSTIFVSMEAAPIRLRDAVPKPNADKVEEGGPARPRAWGLRTRVETDGGDGVRGVVEP